MRKTELDEILGNGENSGVEFMRDDVQTQSLARELSALANLEGGSVLLGVEDDGAVSGLTRDPRKVEEWVMNICRENLQSPIIPYWEIVHCGDGKVVGIVSIPRAAPDKPYRAKQGGSWVTFMRVGSTSRQATREEEARLYQALGLMRYELRPVTGASLDDLERRWLIHYFSEIRGQDSRRRRTTRGGRRCSSIPS